MALSRPRQLQARPRLIITEQPASNKLRFRYSSEGMSGSILGALSRPENPTFPTIKILGYTGFVRIIVSCVTKDEPYRPHPHKLVGREHCHDGVFVVCTEITDENNMYQFRNLGIQCVKRCEVDEALRVREAMEIDPFNTGFSHRNSLQYIDMSAMRLAIEVQPMYPRGTGLNFQPVVSHVIYDKKNAGELYISYPSHRSGPACGGIQVTVLCEKVIRKNIVVVFYQDDEQVWWEQEARIKRVHKQVTILFDTPPYLHPNITNNVKVHFQLRRLTDGATSNPLPFIYHPNYAVPTYIDSKMRKFLKSSLIGSFCEQNSIARPQYSSTSPLFHPFSHADRENRATSLEHSHDRLIACSTTSPIAYQMHSGPSSVDTLYSAASPTTRSIDSSSTLVDISLNSAASSTAHLMNDGPSSVYTMYNAVSPPGHPIDSNATLVDISQNSVASSTAHLMNHGPSSMDTVYSAVSPPEHPIDSSATLVDISLNSAASSTAHLMNRGPSSVDTVYSAVSPLGHPIDNSATLLDISLNSNASSQAHLINRGPSSVDTVYSVASPSGHRIDNSATLLDISLNSNASSQAHLINRGPSSMDTVYSVASPSGHPTDSSTILVDISQNKAASWTAHLNSPSSVDTFYSAASPAARPIHSRPSSVASTTINGGSFNSQTDYIQQAYTGRTSQSQPSWELNHLLDVVMRNYPDLLDDDCDDELLIDLNDDDRSCDSQND